MRHDRDVQSNNSHLWISAFLTFVMVPASLSVDVPDTKGREFLFTAFAVNPDSQVSLEVIPQEPKQVQISLIFPKPSLSPNRSYVIETLQTMIIPVPEDMLLQEEGVGHKGLLLRATADVSIIVRYANQTDICLLFPLDIIGVEYSCLVTSTDQPTDFVLILAAVHSETTVNITGNTALIAELAGSNLSSDGRTLQLHLNAFETYLLKKTDNLSGLLISSDKPLAVWSGLVVTDKTVDNFIWEMLPPLNTWGKKFVLIPAGSLPNFTARLLVRSNANVTVQTSTGLERYELPETTTLTLSFSQQMFVYILSTSVALVVQTTSQINDGIGETQSQMFYVPPVEQYLNSYYFAVSATCRTVCLKTVSPSKDIDGFLLDGAKLSSFADQVSFVIGQVNFTVVSNDAISTGLHDLDHVIPSYSFCAYANHGSSENSFHPLGMRMTSLYNACRQTSVTDGGLGDGKDNDCDGLVDEELFNQKDDDNDGLVDEDTADLPIDISYSANEISIDESESETIDNNLIAVIVSLTVAICAILLLIGSCLLHDFLKRRRGLRSTRITPFVS